MLHKRHMHAHIHTYIHIYIYMGPGLYQFPYSKQHLSETNDDKLKDSHVGSVSITTHILRHLVISYCVCCIIVHNHDSHPSAPCHILLCVLPNCALMRTRLAQEVLGSCHDNFPQLLCSVFSPNA